MKKTAYIFVALLLAAASIWNITKTLPGALTTYAGTGEIVFGIGILVVGFFVLAGFLTDEVSSILLALVGLLLAFPLVRLAAYLVVEMINFRVEPLVHARREWIGIAIIYVILTMFFLGLAINEEARKKRARQGFVPKTKEGTGPDGKTYVLPADAWTGWRIMYGWKDGHKKPEVVIENKLHELLWDTEFCDILYQSRSIYATIVNYKGDYERRYVYASDWQSVAERWEGKPVYAGKRLVFQLPQKYVDTKKAVRFYEMAAEMAYKEIDCDYYEIDPRGSHHDRDLKAMEEICDRLIQIYQNGIPGVAPSQEKVKYYTDYFEEYKKEREKAVSVWQKKKAEWAKEREQEKDRAEYIAWRRSLDARTDSPEEGDESDTQTVFAFPRFIYDGSENPWELMNSGYDNATYYCQKTGETETFYKSDFEFGVPSGFHLR